MQFPTKIATKKNKRKLHGDRREAAEEFPNQDADSIVSNAIFYHKIGKNTWQMVIILTSAEALLFTVDTSPITKTNSPQEDVV